MSEEKKSGCMKYLACGCIVFVILCIVGGVIAYYSFKSVVSGVAEKYTETSPRPLPAPVVSEQQVDSLMKQVNEFAEALKQDKPAQELVLSSDEVNVLFNKYPGLSQMAGKVNIQMEGDRINSQLSVPLGELSSMFKGKYLNGSGVFRAKIEFGRLMVFADSIEVRGEKLPDTFMKSFSAGNLAEKVNADPNAAPILQKIDSLSVQDGKLHIVPKKKL